jgi:cytidine deaminase
MLNDPKVAPLLVAATAARNRAYAPFSGFKVGAAVQSLEGIVYAGCNVESASYGLTLCAERVALAKAISEGARRFARVAVVADTDDPTPPCGACRQLLWELCGNVEVYLVNLKQQMVCYMLGDLLPLAFEARLLPATGKSQPPTKGIDTPRG